jgi:STE24 endopeptidase
MRALFVVSALLLIVLAQGALLPPREVAPALPADLVGDGVWLVQARQLGYMRLGLYVVNLLLPPLALWLFVRGGSAARLRGRLQLAGVRNQWLLVAVYSILLLAGLALLQMPIAFAGYLLRLMYGLAAETVPGWLARFAMETAISIGLMLVALLGLYWILRRFPRRWWLGATAGYMLLSFAQVYLYPLVITPLFFTQQPLADEMLRTEIIELGARVGMEVDQVWVIDASTRGAEGNAYVAGVGGSTRIVLYDTLLDAYPMDELLTIVGHELGHWREWHIWKGLLISWAVTPLALFATHVLALTLLPRWGIRHIADIAGLPLLLLLLNLAMIGTLPLQNWQSRRWEQQADRIALEATGDPEAFTRTFARLARQNLANPTPPRLAEVLFATHPAIGRRVDSALRAFPDA